MEEPPKERWELLCALALTGKDPDALVQLANEISRLLEGKNASPRFPIVRYH